MPVEIRDASLGPSCCCFVSLGGSYLIFLYHHPPPPPLPVPWPHRALYGMVLGADGWLPVSISGQAWDLGTPWLFVLFSQVEGSQTREMQSTTNYLWHTDDLLGQGATASVYKARNKVIATLVPDPYMP